MLTKLFTVYVLALALAGCATPTAGDYTVVPANKIIAAPMVAPGAVAGEVEIRRLPGFAGMGLTVTVAVDGIDAFAIDGGQIIRLRLPPGDRRVSVRWEGDVESAAAVRILVSAGSLHRLAVSLSRGPSFLTRAPPMIFEQ